MESQDETPPPPKRAWVAGTYKRFVVVHSTRDERGVRHTAAKRLGVGGGDIKFCRLCRGNEAAVYGKGGTVSFARDAAAK